MKSKLRNLSFEPLEERRLLTVILGGINYDPPPLGEEWSVVAPPQAGFSPIALPTGVTPPGTTTLSTPPGELPPEPHEDPPWFLQWIKTKSYVSESYASTLAVGFLRTHTNAVGDVTETIDATSYAVALEVHDAADFFHYAVNETALQVAVSYVVRDGTHSEILALREITTAELISQSDPAARHSGLVYLQFDNDLLTAAAIHSEIAGVDTLWVYPEAGGGSLSIAGGAGSSAGLGSLDDLAALDALVSAHLDGPAAGVTLDTYHFAADQYFALLGAVPEPTSLLLAALGAPLLLPRGERALSYQQPGASARRLIKSAATR